MKGIVVTPELHIRVQDFERPLHKSVGTVVGGYIETIYPRKLPEPFVMIGDEEALLKENPIPNALGSFLYETHKHGHPICGTIVFMAVGWTGTGRDIIGLDESQVADLCGWLAFIASAIRGGGEERV